MSAQPILFELETDLSMALENLFDSLNKISTGETTQLKWAIIFSHAALQSAMCLALITTASFLVRKRDTYESEYGDLDNIEWLYKKLQIPNLVPYVDGKVIPENPCDLEDIKRLQNVRNTFIHQHPYHYYFTYDEFMKLIRTSIKLVRFLVCDSQRMALGAFVSQSELEKKLSYLENII